MDSTDSTDIAPDSCSTFGVGLFPSHLVTFGVCLSPPPFISGLRARQGPGAAIHGCHPANLVVFLLLLSMPPSPRASSFGDIWCQFVSAGPNPHISGSSASGRGAVRTIHGRHPAV